MAFCPQCAGALEATAIACPHCGYDFPPSNANPRRGFAYSPLANIALFVGILAAGFGSFGAVLASVTALLNGQWLAGLVVGPLAFFLQLAMLVVFVRVQRM